MGSLSFFSRPLCLLAATSAVALGNPVVVFASPDASLRVLGDLVEDFDSSRAQGAAAASASLAERAGGRELPGIFLHPTTSTEATYTSARLELPERRPQESVYFYFRIGFRDDVPWETGRPNGVRFGVRVNGSAAFAEEISGDGWRDRAIALDAWAGEAIEIALVTDSIDGNSAYDWSVFGQPIVLALSNGIDFLAPEPVLLEGAVGVAFARVECSEPSRLTLALGSKREERAFSPGEHIWPIAFDHAAPVSVNVESGDARVESVRGAPFAPELVVDDVALSSPLVTRDRPFNVVVHLRNAGLGPTSPSTSIEVACETEGAVDRRRISVGALDPGARTIRAVRRVVSRKRGEGRVTVNGRVRTRFFVFERDPDRDVESTSGESVAVHSVVTASARVRLVVERDGRAYAFADCRDADGRWHRSASIYPLAELLVDAKGTRRESATPLQPPFRLTKAPEEIGASGALRLRGSFRVGRSEWPVEIDLRPDAKGSSFRWTTRLVAGTSGDVYLFAGPRVLAGDRSFGAEKSFAIFPGLEYLAAGEASSSERDLAFPLSDRRVPATYKIATTLMAIEANDQLVALLWPPSSAWMKTRSEPRRHLAARFHSPQPNDGYEHHHLSLSVPPVGEFRPENAYVATTPVAIAAGAELTIEAVLALDHRSRHATSSVARGPRRGGLVLESFRFWFDQYGFPAPSPQPRSWGDERALSRHAYFDTLWADDPPGWSHCHGWPKGPFVGHSLPLLLDLRAGVPSAVRGEIERRVGAVLERVPRERRWRRDGCHIALGELPYFAGALPESLDDFRRHAEELLRGRENGLWVWRPSSERHASLGKAGDHTLGQAALPAFVALRAARLTGDAALLRESLAAIEQFDRYDVPRGAQMWECPLYQPDILASAYAIRAYSEAYRITGDREFLRRARYWAWTGLPFLYLWNLEGHPTMRYNVVSVIGSTFFRHSWLGLPVVWCGLVYAYALQDLSELSARAEFDADLDWRKIAQGIVNSAMWQQYTDGPQKGCYPDSWSLEANEPRPADINPENILLNEFRLRGRSPEIETRVVALRASRAFFSAPAREFEVLVDRSGRRLRCRLVADREHSTYASLAPVDRPDSVSGAGAEKTSSEELDRGGDGWIYDRAARTVIFKTMGGDDSCEWTIEWQARE